MKKFIALVAIAVAPALFAQEKTDVKKVSDAKQVEATKVEKKAVANANTAVEAKQTSTATHAKGSSATSLESARSTESRKANAIKEEKTR